MARKLGGRIPVLFTVFSLVVVLCEGLFPTTMTLERAFPVSGDVELSQLIARDRARHGRMLQSTNSAGVVNFPVDGNSFPVGIYYTKVQLGSPPQEFYVLIDTGSDVLWVSCSSCSGCPLTSGLKIPLNSFNPMSSSSASKISCSDEMCTQAQGTQYSNMTCSAQGNLCSYSFQYGDGSTASGYYVSDTFYFDKVPRESQTANSSVVFGCSMAVGGRLTETDKAVDGIFGFGPQSLSVISQLASQGITPKVFSHCLKGDNAGGGILVLGEIVEPNMIYSPLVPSQPHYNVNLESISVNGQALNIDPSVFATSSNGGTIIDSGTTIAYLAEKAYEVVIPAGGNDLWCIGFMGVKGGLTILGDLVLKDKIIVYDLARQRIGWTSYDCSRSVNVSTTSNSGKPETVIVGHSPRILPEKSILWIATTSILYTLMVSSYMFL
ncbi:hypothetical protein CRG98_000855 [Punica granatum]|uniref:Peptidase A1 domain-containing protein n=1 Tax=Punica granatum TaxID=22663 RepID=A0A2I0LDP3_PUNGR|nr:hypothetical protein CRG98_000855 [Punica granatum]